ncbi:alpha/beta hydrolase [Brucepastera parasyntrophica]|uniref:alpha/beta hydrolase n=1 Tax=Brucepastera parasyntrophica TaxID=2880008 RepID=UPI00210B4851|nr:alpha/beta hydrolase [Brucepastera parasyntrophica]ULQ59287.1 alpha/beta hydrolase [Brucepastera parasyntrophica]
MVCYTAAVMSNYDVKSFQQAVKLFKKAVYNHKTQIKQIRKNYDDLLGTAVLPNNIDRQEVEIANIRADLLVPELAIGRKTILYAHGGGFISGSRYSARNLCASIAHETGCRLLLPEYRLSPEYPYPNALEDLYRSYNWLLKQDIPGNEIYFAGDGAGANLVLALTHYLHGKNVTLPGGIIVLSPWTDIACSGASFVSRKNPDPVFTRDIMHSQALQYTYESNFSNPHVSPLRGDLSYFPPIFIQCGSMEIVAEDAKQLAQKAAEAGIPVSLDICDGMWHLFQAFDAITPKPRRR